MDYERAWVFLTRLPDRWFNTVAELFNRGTWRDRETWVVRTLSLFVPYFLFYAIGIYDNITRQGFVRPFHRERLFPTQELFSQPVALMAFGGLCLAFGAGVMY